MAESVALLQRPLPVEEGPMSDPRGGGDAIYSPLPLDDPEKTKEDMASIRISRQSFTQDQLDAVAGLQVKDSPTCSEACSRACKCTCSAQCCQKAVFGFLPFISTILTYKVKYILSDIIAGLSVAIVHIPQGMGFALLASLPAVYGLYSSFWPPLVYFFFGASPHNSMGTMAVISLIIATAVDREVALVPGCGVVSSGDDSLGTETTPGSLYVTTMTPSGTTDDGMVNSTIFYAATNDGMVNSTTVDCEAEKAAIAMTLTLISGLIQFGMGVFQLGIVTTLMPPPFVSGFTTAAAFYIASSQVKHLFGIPVVKYSAMFRLPLTWASICKNLPETNIATLVISILTLLVLIVLKEVINKKFRKKMLMPVPAELIVVVIGTLCCYLADFENKYGVIIIGHIPRGVPVPMVPPMGYASRLITDAVVIAILSFVISFSMADVFARKNRYAVDSNQELLAYGLMHTVSAFFHCFAGASAPPRCIVNDQSGAKTRVSYLWSCALLLLVMLVIGPLFSSLPNAVLGSVIIVALFPMFMQFQQLGVLWRVSKSDFFIWVITWASTVFLDIGVGLGIGIGVVLLSSVVLARMSKGYLLAEASAKDLHIPTHTHTLYQPHSGVAVFRFETTLFYASAQRFKSQLYAATLDPRTVTKNIKRDTDPTDNNNVDGAGTGDNNDTRAEKGESSDKIDRDVENGTAFNIPEREEPDLHTIILDCSTFTFVDISGINVLRELPKDYAQVGVRVVLAAACMRLQRKLSQAGITEGKDGVVLYPTIQDALVDCALNAYIKAKVDETTQL